MSAELKKAVESLYAELDKINERAAELKKNINSLSALIGSPQPFSDVELSSSGNVVSVHPDQFFGKGLATAVREYLKMRGRAATPQEILTVLVAGGFEFEGGSDEKFRLRNLSISLSKNRKDFCYVKSSNAYGLWEFYPDKKRERAKNQKEETDETTEESKIEVSEQK
jgi:hypothetical protein